MNEDKVFKLLAYSIVAVCIAILLTCSWESYLCYLNRKLILEAIKSNNFNWSNEQIQGLLNAKP